MSLLSDTLRFARDVLRLTDEVDSLTASFKEISRQVDDHERRITRLEAIWETALALSNRRIEGSG